MDDFLNGLRVSLRLGVAIVLCIAASAQDAGGIETTAGQNFTVGPLSPDDGPDDAWLGRDRKRVLTSFGAAGRMSGSMDELAEQITLNRHGIYRRTDARFLEVVPSAQNRTGDGYALWREWASRGPCPLELLVEDPWGTVQWAADPAGMLERTGVCSWVVRPALYRQHGYIKAARGPVTAIFQAFAMRPGLEALEVYDGAEAGSPLLVRFTGLRLPHEVTSSMSEMRIVYRVSLSRTILL